jgi:hypothetical protein
MPDVVLPPEFIAFVQSITAKRAKTVIDHLNAQSFEEDDV